MDSKTTSYAEEKKKLDSLVNRANKIIYQIKGVWPFDFFPNTITIDTNKVDIVYHTFYKTKQIVSILITNINYVAVESSLLFAALKFEVKGMEQNPIPVTYLKRKEAIRARRIIMGLLVCINRGIDLSVFSEAEILRKVEEIGIEEENKVR